MTRQAPLQRPKAFVVLADDLTGAAEAAGALLPATARVTTTPRPVAPGEIICVDLGTRTSSPDDASRRVSAALRVYREARVVKKLDSLLRGNVRAELAALTSDGRSLIVAASLPSQRRTVVNGELLVDGRPVTETDSWTAEGGAPPKRVADVVPGPCSEIGLRTVRSDHRVLRDALQHAGEAGLTVVCDGESDNDLRAIARAAEQLPPSTCLAGSAALVHVIGAFGATSVTSGERYHEPVVFVVGSQSTMARTQVAALTEQVSAEIVIPEPNSATSDPGVIRATVAANLNRLQSAGVLILSGGETARAVLDALNISELTAVARWDHGIVASADGTGRLIVTKPGAHGDEDALLRVARAVRDLIDTAALFPEAATVPQKKV